ncbi:MAG: IS3 family transposase [Rikenellaceae bacterium]
MRSRNIKKSHSLLFTNRQVKYQFIESHRFRFNVVKMAKCLNVSTRSYYDWRKEKYHQKADKKAQLKVEIKKSYELSECLYGSVRITADLCSSGTKISRPTVQKYMRELGIKSVLAKKFKVCTTDSRHSNNIAENLLEREFTVLEPNKVWVSDITYIRVTGGFIYLTTVIDLFDRKVVGWSLSNDMSAENTVIPAFKSAIGRRALSATSAHGLMLHSDRGSQYTCNEFIKLLDKYGVVRSNSRKGNCWDNAVAESFFKTLKTELIYRIGVKNSEIIKDKIFAYIEIWYNKKRRHSALDNLTVDEFWDKYYVNINIKKVA